MFAQEKPETGTGAGIVPGWESPLDYAVTQRDRRTLAMVADAIRTRRAMLAFQPVMQARGQGKAAFWEGLIRLQDRTGRTIPARDFIGAVETHELGREIDCLSLEMGLSALAREPALRLAINMSARSIGYPRWIAALSDFAWRNLAGWLAPPPEPR